MLKTRVLVAVVALPILLAVIVIGGELFALVVLGALMFGAVEYGLLLNQGGYRPPLVLILALIVLAVGSTWFDEPDWRDPGLVLVLIAGVMYAIWAMERNQPQPVLDLALAIFGGVYLGWLGSTLLAVRLMDDGVYLVLVIYGSVIVSDSAAYFVGRQWGRHKLTPHVSPKKTWEGYAGSAIAGGVFGALAGGLPQTGPLSWDDGAIIGLLIGTLGTVGDLGISAIKRQVDAKDSSHLIPGHGGVLDRLDSVLVGTAIGYYFLIWFVA
ncbi:MAG: phosphatidate cytidylyltransferase [Anaerolineae bacterium]|nr:phosphatidate cytidylyltransferase [Anaerolineae bacterium]